MSQFDQIVKNIVVENEKCNYSPEKDTNWSELFYFMQRECIKHMDINTRIRLSLTCSDEKSTFYEEVCNFGYIVKTVALESKKCNYNPEIDMNWCKLPMEMRNEVLKRLDFEDRCRFRRVSKTEKALIESRKYHFKYLRLRCYNKNDNWTVETNSLKRYNDTVPIRGCIRPIFQISRFDLFRFESKCRCGKCVKPMLEELVKFAPFQFKRLAVFDNPSIALIMRHCVNLEKVDFRGDFPRYLLKQIIEIPIAMKVKQFRFSRVNTNQIFELLFSLVEKWIDIDAEAGKSIQFDVHGQGVIEMFAGEFASRIIEQTDEIVRIRMNNEKTQILLRLIGSQVKRKRGSIDVAFYEYLSCKVVPINMPESEYGKGDGWIQAVYEKLLKKDGKLKKAMKFDAEDELVWRHRFPQFF